MKTEVRYDMASSNDSTLHFCAHNGANDVVRLCKPCFDRTIAEAVAQERERCAKIAETELCNPDSPVCVATAERIAAAIREGGSNSDITLKKSE